ncbi:hypothetical protein ACFXOM_33075 [Streptomyces sp. NPDC059169]|uniref:hypothetical protein n=1 Tax=Streptomyces sp. NPDC059169 TaxID=3346754 RepID=UPI0036BD338C
MLVRAHLLGSRLARRGPYDRIFVSFAVRRAPTALVEQLAPGGRALMTVGTSSPSWPGHARARARRPTVRLPTAVPVPPRSAQDRRGGAGPMPVPHIRSRRVQRHGCPEAAGHRPCPAQR